MRTEHLIKANHGTTSPCHMIFFDTETEENFISPKEKLLVFKLGWAQYVRVDTVKEEWRALDRPEDMADFLDSLATKQKTIYVYAHNLYFDFRVCRLDVLLPERGWKIDDQYFAEAGLQCFFSFRRGSSALVFIDTINYFMASVEEIGNRLGLKKGEVDFRTATREELSAYCKRDVQVISKAVREWHGLIKKYDLGTTAKTLAGQSMNAFRHRFMDHKIHIHNNQEALALEQESYHGGRVEAWRIGKIDGEVYKLDVNSMYPFVMRNNPFPTKLIYHQAKNHKIEPVRKALDRHLVVARCVIRTDRPCYPVVTGHRLLFPVGEFETVLCTESVLQAALSGELQAITELAIYEHASLFKSYVGYFWGKRRETQKAGDEIYSWLFKILMNSLYGKFGQTRTHDLGSEDAPIGEACIGKEFIPLTDRKRPQWAKDSHIIELDGVDYLRANAWTWCGKTTRMTAAKDPANNAFPAVASHVTEYARNLLWSLIEKAGRENIYYMDTDCVFTNKEGYQRLAGEVGSDLGQLKLEGISDEVEIFAPKDYRFGTEVKLKGISKKAEYNAEDDAYSQLHFEKIRGGLREGYHDGISLKTVTKRLGRKIENRVVGAGGETSPLSMGG